MEYSPHKVWSTEKDGFIIDDEIKTYYKVWDEIREDPYRPSYHFCNPFGFGTPFDPNGLLYSNNRYHLFFIFQNDEGEHCWGHASTIDFVHWKMHKPALIPDGKLGGDRIYSGNCFLDLHGTPTAAFCGYNQGVCLASCNDDALENWSLFAQNPVIPIPDKNDRKFSLYNLYDADVWIEDGTYKMLVGGIVQTDDEKYDTAYLYTSNNLIDWQYQKEFYKPEQGWTNPHEDCACPDFFRLNDKYVLVCISHMYGARAYIGEYNNGVFKPEKHVRINHQGGCLFAPESMAYKGKRLLMVWATDSNLSDNPTTRYSTCMALPRLMELDGNNLKFYPIETLCCLEYNHRALDLDLVNDTNEFLPYEFSGNTKKLHLGLRPKKTGLSGIKVLCSKETKEETCIFVDWDRKTINIDFSRSGLNADNGTSSVILLDDAWKEECCKQISCQTAELYGECEEGIVLDIYIDKSIIEVFTDNGPALAQRVYPTSGDSINCKFIGRKEDIAFLESDDMDAASQI